MKIEHIGDIISIWTTEELTTYLRYHTGGWALIIDDTFIPLSLEENNKMEEIYWNWKKS